MRTCFLLDKRSNASSTNWRCEISTLFFPTYNPSIVFNSHAFFTIWLKTSIIGTNINGDKGSLCLDPLFILKGDVGDLLKNRHWSPWDIMKDPFPPLQPETHLSQNLAMKLHQIVLYAFWKSSFSNIALDFDFFFHHHTTSFAISTFV